MIILLTRSGTNQTDMSRYGITNLITDNSEQPDVEYVDNDVDMEGNEQLEQPNEQPNEEPNEQANIVPLYNINITTLNLLFNYINKRDVKISSKDFALLRISEKEKQGIINCLKRLDVFVKDTDMLIYMSDEQILDLKIMYWVIKEIYLSPHSCLISRMNKTKFKFRFLKAKKYKSYSKIEEFTAYFIKCLQNELETA